jgi:hypothetical protein
MANKESPKPPEPKPNPAPDRRHTDDVQKIDRPHDWPPPKKKAGE